MHFSFFFFFNDTATTEIYTLSLHDALPISRWTKSFGGKDSCPAACGLTFAVSNEIRFFSHGGNGSMRSEEHTSELQSRLHLVCRLLLEKKKKEKKMKRIISQQFVSKSDSLS